MILNDREIAELCESRKPIVEPFYPKSIRKIFNDGAWQGERFTKSVISFGVSSFGYDIRVGRTFKIFKNTHCTEIDPKNIDDQVFETVTVKDGEFIRIPPNSFALAESMEHMRIPDDVLGIVYGKSTYARCGIITNVTPLEPGWHGTITLEISNTTPLPARIYAGEGLCQVLFLRGNRPNVTYADRKGKYQNQSGITLPEV